MFKSLAVMALVALCAGLAHSFSWEIVAASRRSLKFFDNNGTLTHTENMKNIIRCLTYDPVHNRVLFEDRHNIYSFAIATKITESLLRDTNGYIMSLAYDPATELLFWSESLINSSEVLSSIGISLKSKFNNNDKVNEKHFIFKEAQIRWLAVDSCGGFVYWTSLSRVFRARFNGSEREVVIDNVEPVTSLTIDQYSQNMYFADETGFIKSADLNGKNIRTMLSSTQPIYFLIVLKKIMYFQFVSDPRKYNIWQIPRSSPRGMDVEPKLFIKHTGYMSTMAANYNIKDITRENHNCDTLKSLLPNNSVSNTDVSLLCVHGTKVSGESRCECTQGYSGERCDVPVCHNYCLHGDCSASAEGELECRCNPGFSGERCELNVCQGYCLNDGVCSLREDSNPLCRCTGHYEGERCEFPVFLIKCSQTVSMLRDILNTDATSDKWVKSSCASTAG